MIDHLSRFLTPANIAIHYARILEAVIHQSLADRMGKASLYRADRTIELLHSTRVRFDESFHLTNPIIRQ